jgi:cytoskeletal protein CcmA (bactofilin family)
MEHISGGLFSAGIAVIGSLAAKGPMTLAGTVAGDVVCEGKLIVTGHVTGKVTAPEAEISGFVEGDISISGTLIIHTGAKVTGDISAETLSVEEAAAVNGRLSVGRVRAKAGEARLAAFAAKLRERFAPSEVLSANHEENLPETQFNADKTDEDRRQRLKNAADKLKAQKGKKQKPGAGRPTKEKE